MHNEIPALTQRGISNYVERHIAGGSFLTAVFANDLFKAIGYADENNLYALKAIVSYVAWNTPSECRGSLAQVNSWLAQKKGEEV